MKKLTPILILALSALSLSACLSPRRPAERPAEIGGAPPSDPETGSASTVGRFSRVSRLAVMSTEVTSGHWRDVMGSIPLEVEQSDPRMPVVGVNLCDVLLFANAASAKDGLRPIYLLAADARIGAEADACSIWLKTLRFAAVDPDQRGYELPSVADWESYATVPATAGSLQPAIDRTGGDLDAVAWHARNSGGEAHPVALLNANRHGLFDTIGNVAEWVFPGGSVGGSFSSSEQDALRAVRSPSEPEARQADLGFRLVRVCGSVAGHGC